MLRVMPCVSMELLAHTILEKVREPIRTNLSCISKEEDGVEEQPYLILWKVVTAEVMVIWEVQKIMQQLSMLLTVEFFQVMQIITLHTTIGPELFSNIVMDQGIKEQEVFL